MQDLKFRIWGLGLRVRSLGSGLGSRDEIGCDITGYVRTTSKVIIIPHGPASQAIFGLVHSFRATMPDLPRTLGQQHSNNFQVAFSRSNEQGSCIIFGGFVFASCGLQSR